MLSPWIDVGGVGTSALRSLEKKFRAVELGKLKRPGQFYDFTRYRPVLSLVEGRRIITVPNTTINYAIGDRRDVVFFHFLEPHAMGEVYVESVLRVLEILNVKRYCLIGGMYDTVPHTRPLLVTGSATPRAMDGKLRSLGVKSSHYQGPTTINIMVSEQAPKQGIETMTLIVHLPHYTQLEEDYSGQYSLLSLISELFGFSLDLRRIKRVGEEQYQRISQAVDEDPEVKELVSAMERSYDEGEGEEEKEQTGRPRLSPEIERFLKELAKRFDAN